MANENKQSNQGQAPNKSADVMKAEEDADRAKKLEAAKAQEAQRIEDELRRGAEKTQNPEASTWDELRPGENLTAHQVRLQMKNHILGLGKHTDKQAEDMADEAAVQKVNPEAEAKVRERDAAKALSGQRRHVVTA